MRVRVQGSDGSWVWVRVRKCGTWERKDPPDLQSDCRPQDRCLRTSASEVYGMMVRRNTKSVEKWNKTRQDNTKNHNTRQERQEPCTKT
jgi:hypothetical protein